MMLVPGGTRALWIEQPPMLSSSKAQSTTRTVVNVLRRLANTIAPLSPSSKSQAMGSGLRVRPAMPRGKSNAPIRRSSGLENLCAPVVSHVIKAATIHAVPRARSLCAKEIRPAGFGWFGSGAGAEGASFTVGGAECACSRGAESSGQTSIPPEYSLPQ